MYSILSDYISNKTHKDDLYDKLVAAKLSDSRVFVRVTENVLRESGIVEPGDILLLLEVRDQLKKKLKIDLWLNYLVSFTLIASVFLPYVSILDSFNITGMNLVINAEYWHSLFTFKGLEDLIFWNPILKICCGIMLILFRGSNKDWHFFVILFVIAMICLADYRLFAFLKETIQVNPFNNLSIGYYLSAPLLVVSFFIYNLLGYGKY